MGAYSLSCSRKKCKKLGAGEGWFTKKFHSMFVRNGYKPAPHSIVT